MSMVRIDEQSHQRLKRLCQAEGCSQSHLLQRLLEHYETQLFFGQLQEGFQRLSEDRQGWADYQADVEAWNGTLNDGLPPESWDGSS